MDPDEIKKSLKAIDDGLANIQKSSDDQKSQQEKILSDFDASQKAFEEWKSTKDERDEKNQKALDELIKKASSMQLPENDSSFPSQFTMSLKEHFASIRTVSKSRSFSFDVKAAATMLESTHITGNLPRSVFAPAVLPGAKGYNFRDLVNLVRTDTGLITLPREITGGGGSISRVPENAQKPLMDYKFQMIPYTADYIAGIVIISKQMLQDLSFLQSYLPQLLTRDFMKAENDQFYRDLTAVATGSTTSSGANYAEKIIDYIANLGAAGYTPNGIVGTYQEWASLLKTTQGGFYTLPGGVTYGPSGEVRVVGIPYYPVNWIAANKTLVGDWTQANIAVADPLKVEFFEQDATNVQYNLITVRIEAREVLVVNNPAAFVFA